MSYLHYLCLFGYSGVFFCLFVSHKLLRNFSAVWNGCTFSICMSCLCFVNLMKIEMYQTNEQNKTRTHADKHPDSGLGQVQNVAGFYYRLCTSYDCYNRI
jgi:hypothetical protein